MRGSNSASPPVLENLCPHKNAVPVDLVNGERVAWLCPDCDEQLSAGFEPPVPVLDLAPQQLRDMAIADWASLRQDSLAIRNDTLRAFLAERQRFTW